MVGPVCGFRGRCPAHGRVVYAHPVRGETLFLCCSAHGGWWVNLRVTVAQLARKSAHCLMIGQWALLLQENALARAARGEKSCAARRRDLRRSPQKNASSGGLKGLPLHFCAVQPCAPCDVQSASLKDTEGRASVYPVRRKLQGSGESWNARSPAHRRKA